MALLLLLSLAASGSPATRVPDPVATPPVVVQRADSTSSRDRALSVDIVKKVIALGKQLDSAKIRTFDSLAQARGLVKAPVRFGSYAKTNARTIPRDSAFKAFASMAARTAVVYGIAEARPLLASSGLTPEEYAWIGARLSTAWAVAKTEQKLKQLGRSPEFARTIFPVTDADLGFVKAHEADIQQAGFDDVQRYMPAGGA